MTEKEYQLLDFLSEHMTEGRINTFKNIIKDRTRQVTIVLEELFQPHNASAIIRSCDCFGIQDLHIVENRNEFTIDREIAMGSSKWVNIYSYDSIETCINSLKNQGYKVLATLPNHDAESLYEVNYSQKIAFLFGTELKGLTEKAISMADGYVKIPMYGFTESFNVSVSAALCMYEASKKLRELDRQIWELSTEEKAEVQLYWSKKSIKSSAFIEEVFNQKYQTEATK